MTSCDFLFYERTALTIKFFGSNIGFWKLSRSPKSTGRNPGSVGKILVVAGRFPLVRDPHKVLLIFPGVQARHLSAGILISVVSGVVKFFYFSSFRLNFSPKISLNIFSLQWILFLILKTTCVVFLETFVNFLQACRGFHFERNHHGDLYDHWCLKSKLTLFILFRFPCVYDVRKSYTFFSCK